MDRLEEANQANREVYPQTRIENLSPKLLEGTYTVEFYHSTNNLTVCVDVISTDDIQAVNFARKRFSLDSSWELVGSDRKYKQGES